MTYFPKTIKLTPRRSELDATFGLAIGGSFCDIEYVRRRLVGLEVTRMKGSGAVSPFLVELFWALRAPASRLMVRTDLQPDEDGERLVDALRKTREDVTLEGPRGAKGYEFHTTASSIETLTLLLAEWTTRAPEYFVIYYARPEELRGFREELKAKAFNHGRLHLVAPFLGHAELIISDESDRELNLFAIFGRSDLMDTVVRVIDEQCKRFGIRLEENLDRSAKL